VRTRRLHAPVVGLLCLCAAGACAPATPSAEAAGQGLLDHLLAVVAEPNGAVLLDPGLGADGSATVTVYDDAVATAGGGLFTSDAKARLCVVLAAVPDDPGTATLVDAPCTGDALPRLPDGSREVTLDDG
jgi:hypothetical protein